ncbi:MAG: asparagine synthase (glutamine-hydrolyzing) [Pseudomonadota bacterium]
MCGIAGIFRFCGPPDLGPLDAMRDAQAHRGPDEARSERFPEGGLATVRLAIVDPAHGQQPRCDPSGRFWVAMNGEVYNHAELRAAAVARGRLVRTTSDTEVLALLVAELGVRGALAELEGMFGLAVYDRQERRLTIARDRMGEKPLHCATLADGTFVFASEIKGLLSHSEISREVDPAALGAYLLFEYVPTPRTIYRGISRVEPGSLVEVDATGVRRERFWHLPRPRAGAEGDTEAWGERLAGAFRASIATRRVADVPVGIVLSGGLDSAAVLALAGTHRADPAHTFTVTMPEDPSFDESTPAAAVARRYRAIHHEIPLRSGQLPGLLDALGAHLDEPLGDGSLPATWALYRAVHAAGFKAVLSGDGGDELLGGYPTYLAHRWASAAAPAGPLLQRALAHWPVSYANVSRDYMARRFAAGLGQPTARRNQIWLGAFLPEELPPALRADPWREVDVHGAAFAGDDPRCTAMALDQRLYLGDGVLVKVDRASMASSVEVRTPFLDHHLVSLAADCPVEHKLGLRTTKKAWRQAVRHLLPVDLLDRPKKGFGTPLGPWLRGPCTHLLDDLPERVEAWMPPEQVRRLIAEHRAGRADHRRRLWTLLVLGRWLHGTWGPRWPTPPAAPRSTPARSRRPPAGCPPSDPPR